MRNRTVIVVLAVLAAATAFAGPQAPKHRAPRDPELIDAQGYQQLVEHYRGKPLLVTFWATWCEPCRHEYPMLNELAKQYAPQGLKVVGVNLDDDGDLILMRRFLVRYKPIFPNYRKRQAKKRLSGKQRWLGGAERSPLPFFMQKMGIRSGTYLAKDRGKLMRRLFDRCCL